MTAKKVKRFIRKNKKAIMSGGILVAGGMITTMTRKAPVSLSHQVVKAVTEVPKEPILFGGVPLAELNELAKQVYHGIKVTIDEYGHLVLHYTSKSRKTTFRPEIWIDELGKLAANSRHYPNQWHSPLDSFLEKANALYTFKR